MLKTLISPFQRVLINKGMCPGCTLPLDKGKVMPFDKDLEMVICKCRRMYIKDRNTGSYRRATLKEGEQFSKK
ncbi:MAG: hypothetical protein ABIC57_02660 [bacterium]